MPFKNKEAGRAYYRKWQQEHPENNRKAQRKYYEKNPQQKLLKSSRGNAKPRGLEHTITTEDIVVPEYCPYLKVKLHIDNISIDRIDSTKGYIPGNIQVISKLANLMKSSATKEELIQFAKSILEMEEL